MKNRTPVRISLYILIVILQLQSISCSASAERLDLLTSALPTQVSAPAVDPIFREFYDTLGGHGVLGSALTEMFEQDGRRCQFTEAALMCFNPVESNSAQRFSLEPLGLQLGVRETAIFHNTSPGTSDLGDGFILYDEFSALYDRLYGSLYAGKPLTQLRVDQNSRRYEQFFENVGFYRGFDEPPGTAHLIPYGAYLCGPDCSKNLNEYWQIVQSGLVAQPFATSVKRLGWFDLGAPVTQPRLNPDGMLEQVYDNVILYAPQDALNQVRFRPVVSWLGKVPPEPLVAKNPHEQLVFYEVENGLGHNVPLFFDRFIANHGGRDLAGNPLTEFFAVKPDQLFRQCFENYCLDYYALAPEGQRVRMAPLGLEYERTTNSSQLLRQAFSTETVLLKTDAGHSKLASGEEQPITMHVYRRDDGQPLYLVDGTLTLNMPDLPPQQFHLKPTDRSGASTVVIPPLKGLAPMSVVEYHICLNLPGDPKICSTESFIYQGG
jgi:hypothetical protein